MINIKKIGVIFRTFIENNKNFLGIRNDLFTILNDFNVTVIGIPINSNFKSLIEMVNLCDGIILSGGSNFVENDFKLVKYLYENDIPTLGICLGMQAMAEYFNNYEEEEISNHYSSKKYVHYLNLAEDSLLYNIIKKDRILVNSRHNSCIPTTTLKVNAMSDDEIIEGIEAPNKRFFLGVQYHPESINDNNSYRLFAYFISIL